MEERKDGAEGMGLRGTEEEKREREREATRDEEKRFREKENENASRCCSRGQQWIEKRSTMRSE